jgi:glycine dehydrogenase subunit 2
MDGLPSGAQGARETYSGNRGLAIEEGLIFEVGSAEVSGVDLPEVADFAPRLGGLERSRSIGLAGLSEPEALRHYVRLSQKNYAIDAGPYPLGSCTMKHNPRLNERLARLPGFGDIHPLQPLSTVPGAVALIAELGRWLRTLTGMPAVAMTPKAGAHGELCGMMAIKAALLARGERRTVVLVPASAHGTNPATAALLGFRVETVPARGDGTVDPAEVARRLSPQVAAIMLTNPNTCGLFERDVVAIAAAVHAAGGFVYADGANFNAVVGKVRPGDLGVDAMHINLHKTFSTPHGGGGPGAGPVVLSAALAPFLPLPYVIIDGNELAYVESAGRARPVAAANPVQGGGAEDRRAVGAVGQGAQSLGRMCAFHGQMGMYVRALAYMLSHGVDGLRQASEDAVLNANYLRVSLGDLMSLPFGNRPCMHEVLFDDRWLEGTGVTTLDFAKRMIDEGLHPMTVYFPLVVHGAMLIEPTESESRRSLDGFIGVLRALGKAALSGDAEGFRQAPRFAPRRRLDETRAARTPRLVWSRGAAEGSCK